MVIPLTWCRVGVPCMKVAAVALELPLKQAEAATLDSDACTCSILQLFYSRVPHYSGSSQPCMRAQSCMQEYMVSPHAFQLECCIRFTGARDFCLFVIAGLASRLCGC
jgi:hypothetical protein